MEWTRDGANRWHLIQPSAALPSMNSSSLNPSPCQQAPNDSPKWVFIVKSDELRQYRCTVAPMAATDIYDDLAALALPLPDSPDQVDPPEAFDDACDAVRERRIAHAAQLRGAELGDNQDPLLTELAQASRARAAADEQLRRLVAYGREFQRRPYPLADLARAAGLGSHSSARTFYSEDTVADVARLTGATPYRRPGNNPTTA